MVLLALASASPLEHARDPTVRREVPVHVIWFYLHQHAPPRINLRFHDKPCAYLREIFLLFEGFLLMICLNEKQISVPGEKVGNLGKLENRAGRW